MLQAGMAQMNMNPVQAAAAEASISYGRALMQGQVQKFLPQGQSSLEHTRKKDQLFATFANIGVAGAAHGLKYYFRVDNSYLLKKVKV